ncbi:MAG: PAS domain-containing protein, partial [Bacteroidia bacterium]
STLKFIFSKEDYKTLSHAQAEAFRGKTTKVEIQLNGINGKTYFREMNFSPIIIKGKINEIAAVAQDTTERRNYEKQITEHAGKLKAIFDSGMQRIWTVDKNLLLTSFNENFERSYENALGKKPVIGGSPLAVVQNSALHEFWIARYKKALKGQNLSFEMEYTSKDGKQRYGQVILNPIYNDKKEVVELAALSQDITERKTAEKKVAEQAARLGTIFNSGDQLMWTVNKNIALTSYNKNYADAIFAMYGVHPEINTDLSKPKKTFASKEYHKFWDGKYQEVFKTKKSIEFNTERTTLKGKKIYRHIFLHPIFNEKKQVVEVSGIGYDISAQQLAQEQIVSKQSQLEAIINTTGDIIFSVDKNCKLVEFNNVLKNVIKIRHGVEVKPGTSIYDVLPKLYHKEVRVNYRKAFMGQSVLATEIFYMGGVKRIYEAHYKPIIINGEVTGAAVFSKDITEQERAKQEIITKQFQLSAIINTTSDIILSLDKNFRVVEFNNVMKEIAHLRSGKEMKSGDNFFEFLPKEMHADLKKTYKRALAGENIQAIENFIHPKTKQHRIYSANYNPININGDIVGIAIFSRDITEQKLSEEEVLNKQSRLSAIINNTRDIILSIDKNYNIIEFNEALRHLVKRSFHLELKEGMSVFKTLDVAYHKGIKDIYERVFKGESVISTGTYGEGETKVVLETRYNPIRAGSNITGIAIFSRDITVQKNSEENILKSLNEKEILLKEVHHRVKNNLQVISSILNLQTAYLKDKPTINILKECQNRIKTMAFIHESLYQNKDFSQINFSEYIVTLVKNLFYSFEANQQKIRANFDVEPILLNLDTSIPCGLIVNELVSNALKYAFKETREGVIFVELKKVNDKIKMTIADNGRGIPPEINYKNTETLGLQLVNTLTEQINGTISMKQNKGTIFEIIF